MLEVFQDIFRVLKPNRWITIAFIIFKTKFWNILQNTVLESGFVIADVKDIR